MAVLINGMEMPENCNKCPMTVDGYCRIIGYPNGDALNKRYKPLWCPLVEVPTPHGRLIEAERLMHKLIRYGGISPWSEEELYYTIKDMDTIIEAEE